MLDHYRPQDNYWIIGGSTTHVWSAPSAMASGVELVVVADADYVTWLAAGNTPGSIATAAELYEMLAKQAPEVLTLVAAAQSYLEENHTERSQVVDGAGFTFRQAADEQQSGPGVRIIVPASTFPTGAFPVGIYKADDLVNPVLYVDIDGNVFNSGVYVAGSSEIVLTDAAGLILAAALGTNRTPQFARVGVGGPADATAQLLLQAQAGTIPTFSPGTPTERIIGANATSVLVSYNTFAAAANFVAQRAGGTMASPAATEAASAIFAIGARGWDSTNLYGGGSKAAIIIQSVSAWSPTDNSTQIIFQTTPVGSTTPATVFVIGNGGAVYASGVDTLTLAATISLDITKPNLHELNINAATDPTINFSAAGTAGQHLEVLIHNTSGGSRTVTFGTNTKPNGTVGVTNGQSLIVNFTSNGATFREANRATSAT